MADESKAADAKAIIDAIVQPKPEQEPVPQPQLPLEDTVNKPKHYNMLDTEAIDLIEMSMTKEEFLGYLKGNVLKYIIRYKHKGKSLEDLDKGKWYLERLRDRIDEQRSSN